MLVQQEGVVRGQPALDRLAQCGLFLPPDRPLRARRELPHLVDLFAATLRAGAAPGDGLAVVCAALPGAAADCRESTIENRESAFLTHPVFNTHHSETQMMRYIRSLERKDIGLDTSMIPLGSCTMKLNATTEMEPVSLTGFADLHPFAPAEDAAGYRHLIGELEGWLAEVTGYDQVSIQPNAGSQGELAGLLAIRAYHRANGEAARDICLIPSSAHGTNAASAVMAGMRVVVVKAADDGAIDLDDLRTHRALADRNAWAREGLAGARGVEHAEPDETAVQRAHRQCRARVAGDKRRPVVDNRRLETVFRSR